MGASLSSRTAFSYQRISSGKQAKGSGLERQSDGAASYCLEHGLRLDDSLDLTDAGKSAFKGEHMSTGALGRFLALAEENRLPPDPLLLVEDIDRLTRLEPLDGLEQVVLALLRAGVEIRTLGDGQTYTRERINRDVGMHVGLVLKAHAAAEYSKRLSKRISAAWKRTRKRILDGDIDRACDRPYWVDYCADAKEFTINEHIETIERIFELAEQGNGFTIISKTLNAEGRRTYRGKVWTPTNVSHRINDPRLIGTRLLKHRGKVVDTVPDYYPVAIAPERQVHVQQMVAKRRDSHSFKGKRRSVRYIGQGMTTCSTCGTLCGHSVSSNYRAISYVRCRAVKSKPCGQKYVRLDDLHAHILTRLTTNQLAPFFENQTGKQSEMAREAQAVARLSAKQTLHQTALQNLQAKVVEAAADGAALSLLKTLQDAADNTAEDLASATKALEHAKSRLAGLQLQPSPLTMVDEMQPLIHELFASIAQGTDTAEQRTQLNQLLQKLDARITLDANGKRCGMQFGESEIEWQPITALDKAGLRHGMTGSKAVDLELDAESIELFRKLPKDENGMVDLGWLLRTHPDVQAKGDAIATE